MNRETAFLLSKWYLDCVADSGDAFIGYSAVLRWKALTIHYSSILFHSGQSGTSVKTSLRACSPPRVAGRTLRWAFRPLRVDGIWDPRAEPIKRRLLESREGEITWSCVQPCAAADIRIGTRTRIRGRGYAEFIEMSVRPWQLPIDRLRWGRFLFDTGSIVWINWNGETPLTLLFRNGEQIDNCSISDKEIVIDGGRTILTLAESAVLREGPLLSTALSKIPGIEKAAPLRILKTHECKWRSRGVLQRGGTPIGTGWAIHELVRFA